MPTDSADVARWLRLLLVPGIERRHWFHLTEQFPDPDLLAAQREDVLCSVADFSPAVARRLLAGAPPDEVELELNLLEEKGARLVSRFDPEFPALLRQMSLPPAAFYLAGDLQPDDELAVAIVGPRRPSPYAREIAHRLGGDLARAGLTVVSGFAVGVDSAAHAGTLEAEGRTLGVLGCGLAIDYPSGHRSLRRRIVDGHGGLISEYPMTAPPLAAHFPPRNTLIAGLSLAVIVVEAAERSGALVTARAAGEENRYVYAVPGDVTRATSRGSNALLRDGAIALTCVDDLLEDLQELLRETASRLEAQSRLRRAPRFEPARASAGSSSADTGDTTAATLPAAPGPEDPDARLLFQCIAENPMIDLDALMAEFVPDSFDVGRLSSLLLQLELSGRIRQLPGKTYVIGR